MRECACVPSEVGDPERLPSRSAQTRRCACAGARSRALPEAKMAHRCFPGHSWRLISIWTGILQGAVGNVFFTAMARHRNVRGYNYDEGRLQASAGISFSPFQPGSQLTWHPLRYVSSSSVVPGWNSEGAQLEKIIGHLSSREWHCFISWFLSSGIEFI